ncbi:hypothetical protein [Nakamurella leprariae]|uniref:Uncharacterized protein n=1 Tax=Nakamurella leprariae TaxID=2803911 RepID=A0A938YCX0_9ACTN|nr:hypothetical protein [Nakamurella leprariae]MBM9468347.1 hypothetical protein [Nakamurella leprariae]
MQIHVDPSASDDAVRLVGPDDFKSFAVISPGGLDAARAPLQAAGVAVEDEHAWIPVDLLRRLAGPAADADWETGLAGMLKYAQSKGWYRDSDSSIRAHVESAG